MVLLQLIFACMLFLHLYVTIYYLVFVLATCASHILITESHILIFLTQGRSAFISISTFTSYFHNPRVKHSNPVSSYELHRSVHISLPHSCFIFQYETRHLSEVRDPLVQRVQLFMEN
jgi:hypothetical protein